MKRKVQTINKLLITSSKIHLIMKNKKKNIEVYSYIESEIINNMFAKQINHECGL